MVNAFRYGFLGVSDVDLSVAFGVLGLFIVGLFTLALTLIKRGVGLRH
jgi:ABC-2 type transport system permease protein